MTKFTAGQAVNAPSHKTQFYFVRELPCASFRAGKERAIVRTASGAEYEFYLSELTLTTLSPSKLDATALANTAREIIGNIAGRTIANAIAHWNVCVEQSGFTGLYDFPVEGWTRKAQVIADLARCAEQLDAFDPEAYHASREAQRIADVDQAHDAALLASYGVDTLRRVALFPETVISAEEAHAQALEADLLRTWQTSDITIARACQAAADKGLFLNAVYRHEWKECGGYVDAHADIKMLPRDGKVQLWLRTSAANWWQHDSTHIDAASAYACACAIFETTEFTKLEPGHA